MKLEVGMYVRSKINGMIGKITDIEEIKVFDRYLTVIREETRYILDNNSNRGFCETEKESIKASYTLLGNDEVPSLIERGDYVNGEEVFGLYELDGKRYVDVDRVCYSEEEIKSIVTKEQFSQMKYKVGE